jgi:S-adenosylmethionine:tRNA ribosyltransferase-isomerase
MPRAKAEASAEIGSTTKLRVVDTLLAGAHEPGTSHHALVGAFLAETMLRQVDAERGSSLPNA